MPLQFHEKTIKGKKYKLHCVTLAVPGHNSLKLFMKMHQYILCGLSMIYNVAARDPKETRRKLSGHGVFLAKLPNQLYIQAYFVDEDQQGQFRAGNTIRSLFQKTLGAEFSGGSSGYQAQGCYIIDRPKPCIITVFTNKDAF